MRRRSFMGIVCGLALLALVPVPVSAQSVDEIVARNLQAKGGLDKLRSIQTIRQTSKVLMPQGTSETVVVLSKRPNLLRQEITVGGKKVVFAFDGKTAWAVNPLVGVGTPVVVMGPQAEAIRQQSDFDGPLVDYRARGSKLELVGLETVNGRQLHHLRLIDKNGQTQHYYLDPETGLEARITFATEGGEFEQEFSDYRDVDGIKVPFSVRMLANGVAQSTFTVQKVEFNAKFDDAIFKIPK